MKAKQLITIKKSGSGYVVYKGKRTFGTVMYVPKGTEIREMEEGK